MKNIVVLMEKWCDLNPQLGETSGLSNVVGSLFNVPDIKHTLFHYDEYLALNDKPIDEFLMDYLRENRPDLLFVSFYPFVDDTRNVRPDTFATIKGFGIPIAFIWFDAGHNHIRQLAIQMSGLSTVSVIVDVYESPNGYFLPMWVPQDHCVFHANNCNRDITVSFVGSTHIYPDRRQTLDFLKKHIDLYVSGGQREHNLSINGYADTLRRSKMTLNFPSKPDGTIQAKSRVYEAMLCGSLLLERDNEAIKRWFEPYVHYVPFIDDLDVLTKIDYYSKHEDERAAIAEAGRKKMEEDYNATKWWNKVLERIQ